MKRSLALSSLLQLLFILVISNCGIPRSKRLVASQRPWLEILRDTETYCICIGWYRMYRFPHHPQLIPQVNLYWCPAHSAVHLQTTLRGTLAGRWSHATCQDMPGLSWCLVSLVSFIYARRSRSGRVWRVSQSTCWNKAKMLKVIEVLKLTCSVCVNGVTCQFHFRDSVIKSWGPQGTSRDLKPCNPRRWFRCSVSEFSHVSCQAGQASLGNAEVHGGACLSGHLCLSLQCHSSLETYPWHYPWHRGVSPRYPRCCRVYLSKPIPRIDGLILKIAHCFYVLFVSSRPIFARYQHALIGLPCRARQEAKVLSKSHRDYRW